MRPGALRLPGLDDIPAGGFLLRGGRAGDLFGTDSVSVREFSSVIFLEASKSFDPALAGLQPAARLDVTLLRSSAPAAVMNDCIKSGTLPDSTQIAIEQPVVGLPA